MKVDSFHGQNVEIEHPNRYFCLSFLHNPWQKCNYYLLFTAIFSSWMSEGSQNSSGVEFEIFLQDGQVLAYAASLNLAILQTYALTTSNSPLTGTFLCQTKERRLVRSWTPFGVPHSLANEKLDLVLSGKPTEKTTLVDPVLNDLAEILLSSK